jgi:hypothetical protein
MLLELSQLWRFHNSGLEATEPERQEMHATIRSLLKNKMEDSDAAVQKFENAKLDLTKSRQMAYLLTRQYHTMRPYLRWFMLMYRENRDARFTEA